MKRIILCIACIIMCLGLCACGLSAGGSSSIWKKAFYLDSFKQPTEDFYIGTSKHVKGTYSSSNVTDGKLEAEIRVDTHGISIVLYEDGKNKVINGGQDKISCPITVKKADGSTFRVTGTMWGGYDYINLSFRKNQMGHEGKSLQKVQFRVM